MKTRKVVLTEAQIQVILHRLACQLVEQHLDFQQTCLIGIQPRGVFLLHRLVQILKEVYALEVRWGVLDITFFRDDFRRNEKPLQANSTHIDFLVENQKVVLIDDVLYTGRSVRAALTAIQSFGRPAQVELLTLIDRRFSRHLPIQPDYIGIQVDAINEERICVCWKEKEQQDSVFIENQAKN